jgi:hypothetical protein
MYRAFRSLAVAAFVVVSRASNSIFVFRISSALAVPDLNLLVTTAIHRSFSSYVSQTVIFLSSPLSKPHSARTVSIGPSACPLASRTMKQASVSSTVHGGGKRCSGMLKAPAGR